MKKLLLLLTLALVVFLAVNRQRLYLWDPIAAVMRDGVKQTDMRVMINYSNDVLVDDKSAGRRGLYLVQNWDRTAKSPRGPLKCIQYLACMTDADQAAGDPLKPGGLATMTNKSVEFLDASGARLLVTLR